MLSFDTNILVYAADQHAQASVTSAAHRLISSAVGNAHAGLTEQSRYVGFLHVIDAKSAALISPMRQKPCADILTKLPAACAA